MAANRSPKGRAREGSLVAVAVDCLTPSVRSESSAPHLLEHALCHRAVRDLSRCPPASAAGRLRSVNLGCTGCKKPSRRPVSFHEPAHLHPPSSNLVGVKPSTAPRTTEPLLLVLSSNKDAIRYHPASRVSSQLSFCYFMPVLEQGAWQLPAA